MVVSRTAAPRPLAHWARLGALLGLAAGIAFGAYQLLASWALGEGLLAPLRMAGAIVLGPEAVEPDFSAAAAAGAGAVVHVALSALYGAVFAGICSAVPVFRLSRATLVAAATAWGLLLWIGNFFLIAPLAFPWFLDASQPVQLAGHAFAYGSVLGALLAATRPGAAYVIEQPLDVWAADEPVGGERVELSTNGRVHVVRGRRRQS
jgi:hypothetical protein